MAGHTSRPWRVERGGSARLIGLVLDFFRTNRDGDEPALLHGPSHLNDATVNGGRYSGRHFDLTGGWMDAGDMLHFTQTTAYATTVLELAARIDSAHRSELREEAAVGIRWLMKAHPAPNLFVTQIGDNRDHQRPFSNPALDDESPEPALSHRLAFHWGGGVGGDIGGKVAAALALAAAHSPEPDRSKLVTQARAWLEAGRRSGRATPPIRHAGGFYVVSNWRDSLALGAATLYRVTGEAPLLRLASRDLRRSNPAETLGYDDVAPLAAAEICGRLGGGPLGRRRTRHAACRFLRRNGREASRLAHRNAFGLDGPLTWGTTSSDTAAGAIAALSGRPAVAAGARDYLLGRNPWGASFVTGFGPRRPRRISSWASVFGPAKPRGAVVGGPAPRQEVRDQGLHPGGPLRRFDAAAVYEDNRRDYVTSEPALDYAANTILLLATLSRHR